ncbi:MAG: DUF1351 domain-containing protein [Anaerostipes sp.]|nr:DUF1351 domain-containing protein [Anaerostipes sp.]
MLEVLVKQEIGDITFNFEEIKDNLANQMELYKDATFSEDTKVQAKKEVAALRKMEKAIDSKRKEVKSKCLEPYKAFEEKCNELKELIQEPITLIDTQIKEFEKKRIEQKRMQIKKYFFEIFQGSSVMLEKVYNPKWENASFSMTKIQEEMEETAERIKKELDSIEAMNTDCTEQAKTIYYESLSVTDAISYITNYEKQKAEILANEQEKKALQEREKVQEPVREPVSEPIKVEDAPNDEVLPFPQKNTKTVLYRVVATQEELKDVELAFTSIGIEFSRKDI